MSYTFMACYDNGVTRAERAPHGDWAVPPHATGHKVTCLAADPDDPGRVYAGTRDGVLRSDDAGRTWRPGGMNGRIVKSLAVSSPHSPHTAIADRATWESTSHLNAHPPFSIHIFYTHKEIQP